MKKGNEGKKLENLEQNKIDETNVNLSIDKKETVLTREVKQIPMPLFIIQNIGKSLLKMLFWILDLLFSMFVSLYQVLKIVVFGLYKVYLVVKNFVKRKYHEFKFNNISGRLSFVFFGASSFKHKQIGNGILYSVFEVIYILLFAVFGIPAIAMLSSLGTKVSGIDPSCEDQFCDYVFGDNSVLVLVFGLLWVFSILLFLYIWNRSINSGYDNYRIDNYKKFENIYIVNEEFSNTIDKDIAVAFANNVSKSTYIKQSKEEISNYLVNIKDEDGDKTKFNSTFSKYLILETITNSYANYKKLKKQQNIVEKKLSKVEAYTKKRDEKREKLSGDDIVYEKFDMKTKEKLDKLNSTYHKQADKYSEMIKMHFSFAAKENTVNRAKYEKFNDYYAHIAEIDTKLIFYKNYESIVNVYNSSRSKFNEKNNENLESKNKLAVEIKEKINVINQKYDEMEDRKKTLQAKLDELLLNQKSEIKDLVGSSKEKARNALEIKAKYFPEISNISGQLNEFPQDKVIKALRKEEINGVTHSYKRDRKYLKTNFTELSYAKEEAVNKMIVDYKLPYREANCIVASLFIKDKNTKQEREFSSEEINEIVTKLESEKALYIKENPSKFVGKSKTFVQQIKSLFNENFHLTVLTLPVLGVVFFTIMPLFFSILVAFTNYSFGHVPPTQLFTWAGLLNFITLFNAPSDSMYALLPSAIMQTLGWTLTWTVVATFSNYFLGIILALLINKEGIRFKKLWRTIFIMTIAIPQFISLLSIGVLLKDTGAVGVWFAETFGYRLGFGTDSTNGALVSKIIIILVNIWVGIPYTMLSTSGILMNIPKDLYESARVDGAGTFTQFSKITMPYILFVTGPYLITQFIGNINNFNVIFFLTGGGPNLSGTALQIGHTDLLITFLYKMITSTNNPQFGIASAVGILIFVICSFFSIIMYSKSGAVKSEDQFQ